MRVSRGARRAAISACAALLLGVAACEQPATSDDDCTLERSASTALTAT